jgi:magnesium chelatase accessory protein
MRATPHHVRFRPGRIGHAVRSETSATEGSAASAPSWSGAIGQPSTTSADSGDEAPAVLLLDGPPGTPSIWHWVQPVLRSRGVHACTVTRPGSAASAGQAEDPFTTAAADIARLLHDQRWGPAVVVGYSAGAGTALALAAGAARSVRALVLVAPAAGLPSISIADRLLAAPAVGPVVTWIGFRVAGLALHLPALRRAILTTRAGLCTSEAKQVVAHITFGSSWRTFASDQRRLVSDTRRRNQLLGLIDCPVLVVDASHDRIVAHRTGTALRRLLPGSQVITIAASGRLIPIDDPDSVVDAVLRALREEYRASLSARRVRGCPVISHRFPPAATAGW